MKRSLFCIALCGILAGTSSAQWKSDSTTNTPVCTATASQQNPQACTDGANGVIIVWEDFRSGTNWDVYAQKLNVDGVPQWAANGVNLCTSLANQTSPVICSDGSGGAYIVWKDTRTAANGNDLYSQHIASNGSLQYGATGSGVALAADAAPPNNLTICSDGSGNAFVAWEDSRNSISASSRPDIYMNKLTGGGVAFGGGGVAIAAQTLHQTVPKLVDDGSGGCYLVWVNGTLPASIWGTRLNSNGSSQWGSPGIQIFKGAAGGSDASRNPSVSRDGNQLCVSFEQLNSSNSTKGWNMLANRMNSNGSFVWGNSIVAPEISTDWSGDQINPIVFSDDSAGTANSAGLLVVYEDLSSGSHDVVMTRLLPDGNSLKPSFPNQLFGVCRVTNDQTFPVAVKTGSGELVIVWNDLRSNGGSSTFSSIYAQRCDKTPKRYLGPSPSFSTWGEPISNRVNSNADQVVLVPRTNGAIAVWRDNRNGNTDIYAQLIFKDGSLPIELSNFSARVESGSKVLLNWQTASEKDNAGFEIERRRIDDLNGLNTFEIVGNYLSNTSLLGAGFSNVERNYSFIDQPGEPGRYEYRLADYSLDGERTIQEPKMVEIQQNGGTGNGWSVDANLPNPFSEQTTINFTLAEPAQISLRITDILGRVVAEPYVNKEMSSGKHQLMVSASMLGANVSAGTYYCQITARDSHTGAILWKSQNVSKMSFIRE